MVDATEATTNDSRGALDKKSREKQTVLESQGYFLGDVLGRGSYSSVRIANSSKHKRDVAIKIISKHKTSNDYLTKFLPREIEVAKVVRHKNVVCFLKLIETTNRVYIIMELASGGDILRRINKEHFIEEGKARMWFHNLVDGIEHCHGKRVVHRDLKCENLLLDSKDVLKITDFGFAKIVDKIEDETVDKVPPSSLSSTFCGSYAYASPEILKGVPYIPHLADIWSMGVILFAMIYGRLPFDDSNRKTLLQQVQKPVEFPTNHVVSLEAKHLLTKILVSASCRISIKNIQADPWYKCVRDPKK